MTTITIKKCTPDDKEHRGSATNRDVFTWKNEDPYDRHVVFHQNTPSIFEGSSAVPPPPFTVPAKAAPTKNGSKRMRGQVSTNTICAVPIAQYTSVRGPSLSISSHFESACKFLRGLS